MNTASIPINKSFDAKIIVYIFAFLIIMALIGIGYNYLTSGKIIEAPIVIPIAYATDDGVNTTVEDEFIVLFRGVHALHPDLPNAKIGIAMPIGGHSDPELHNLGDNKSVFTSWTTNIWIANSFASRKGKGGIILTKQFHISRLVPSADSFQQGEWLVSGIVKGAIPLQTFEIDIPTKK